MPDLPEEAVEALAKSLYADYGASERWTWDQQEPHIRGIYLGKAEEYLAPAVLAIEEKARKQERERVKAALVGKDAMLAWGGRHLVVYPETFERIFAALEDSDAS